MAASVAELKLRGMCCGTAIRSDWPAGLAPAGVPMFPVRREVMLLAVCAFDTCH